MAQDECGAGPVIVTGALGQDGWLLAERLAAAGRRVIGVARPGRAAAAAALPVPPPCELVELDLTDPATTDDLIARLRPARLFHIAAVHHASDAPLAADPALWRGMTAVNFTALTHFVQGLMRHAPACRLVYAASSHMYRPDPGGDRLIAEDDRRDPPSWYGLTKSWSMDALKFARDHGGLHASGAILFNHESPRRPEAFVSRKITRAAARIANGSGERLALRNIGARADWCCAEDVVDGLIRMADAAAPADCVIGSGVASCVRDMVEEAFAAAGLDWTAHVDAAADRPSPALIADTTRIRRDLGWAPRRSLREVIRRMTLADLADAAAVPALSRPGLS